MLLRCYSDGGEPLHELVPLCCWLLSDYVCGMAAPFTLSTANAAVTMTLMVQGRPRMHSLTMRAVVEHARPAERKALRDLWNSLRKAEGRGGGETSCTGRICCR